LTKKNIALELQVAKKIEGICQNPEIGEPKSHNLRGLRGLHVTEHHVIVYFIFRNYVVFIELDLHDKAYTAAEEVAARLLYDTRLLAALETAGISQEEFADFMKTIGRPK
jgi:hypothetical protein